MLDRYKYTTLRDVIVRGTKNFVRKAIDVARGRQVMQGDEVEEFWALKKVRFEDSSGANKKDSTEAPVNRHTWLSR